MRMSSARVCLVWFVVVWSMVQMFGTAQVVVDQRDNCIAFDNSTQRTSILSGGVCTLKDFKLGFNISKVKDVPNYAGFKLAFEVGYDLPTNATRSSVLYKFGDCTFMTSANGTSVQLGSGAQDPSNVTDDYAFRIAISKDGYYRYDVGVTKVRSSYRVDCNPFLDGSDKTIVVFEQQVDATDGQPNVTLTFLPSSTQGLYIGNPDDMSQKLNGINATVVSQYNATSNVTTAEKAAATPAKEKPEESFVLWIILGVLGTLVVVLVILGIVGICFYRRFKAKKAAKAAEKTQAASTMGTVTTNSQMTTAGTTAGGEDEQINVVVQQ